MAMKPPSAAPSVNIITHGGEHDDRRNIITHGGEHDDRRTIHSEQTRRSSLPLLSSTTDNP